MKQPSETKDTATAIVAPVETPLELDTVESGMEFCLRDIDIPKLNVIQKMSEIDGAVGSIVLDQTYAIAKPEEKIKVVLLSAIKRWKEDAPFGGEYKSKYASTQAEADALGRASDYEIIETAEISMLIPQPEGFTDDDAFPYVIGDTNYQLGRITVQKDAYRLTYKRMYTFSVVNPKVAITSRFWNFGPELFTKGKYSWYTPTLSITKESPDTEVLEFAARLSSSAR